MQLIPHHRDVGPLHRQLTPSFPHNGLAKAVVLPYEVDTFDATVFAQRVHESGHAHIRMGIKAEVPKTAFFIRQRRIDRRVIQEHNPFGRFAFIVFVDSLHQRAGGSRGVALQNKTRTAVNGRAQRRQRFLSLALAVVTLQHQGSGRSAGQLDAPARIHPLHSPQNIAVHRFAAVGVGAA